MSTLEKQLKEAMIPIAANPGRICPESMGWTEDSGYVSCRAAHITHMVNQALGVPAVTHVDRDGVIVDFDDATGPRHRRHAITRAGTGICITRSMPLVAGDTPLPCNTHVLEFNGYGDLTSSALFFDHEAFTSGERALCLPTTSLPFNSSPGEDVRYRKNILATKLETGRQRNLILEVLESVGRRTGGKRVATIDKLIDPCRRYPRQPGRSLPDDGTGRKYVDSRFVDHAAEKDIRTGRVIDLSRRVPLRDATIHELFEVFRRQVNDAAGCNIIAKLPRAA